MRYLTLLLFLLAGCPIEFTENTNKTCDDAGVCVCDDEGFTDCGDFRCYDLMTDRFNCGGCGISAPNLGGGSCIDGVPVCQSSDDGLCGGDTPYCSDTGCEAFAEVNCNLERPLEGCSRTTQCNFDAAANAYNCIERSCTDAFDCDIEGLLCENDICVQPED